MSGLYFDSLKTKQQGKPDAGKPHVRFDEGEASCPCLGGNLSTLLAVHFDLYCDTVGATSNAVEFRRCLVNELLYKKKQGQRICAAPSNWFKCGNPAPVVC